MRCLPRLRVPIVPSSREAATLSEEVTCVEKIRFCDACGREQLCRSQLIDETYPVRGEDVTVQAEVLQCSVCGTGLFEEALDEANLERAYAVYRQRYHLLSGADIRAIRQQYGLSQRAMARLLGWGEMTMQRYESGAIPDRVHSDLLRLLARPSAMRWYLDDRGETVPTTEANTIRIALEPTIDAR